MKVTAFLQHYSYTDARELEAIRTLTLSNSPMRIIQIPFFPFTFLLDGILVVQISPPGPSSYSSERQLNQYMCSVSKKVQKILSIISEFRKEYYEYQKNFPTSFSIKYMDSRLAPIERESFLTQKLSNKIKDMLSFELHTQNQKETWLRRLNSKKNIFNIALSVKNDYTDPILYNLQELYKAYSIEEEMFSVRHALNRLSLPGIMYKFGISEDKCSIRGLDLEIAFRIQFLKTAYASLESHRLPNNINDLEDAFRAFYLHVVKWTLIKTLQNHPDLQEPFSQIPADSPFWEETTLTKSWWDFIVKTLNPQICVYTLSPTPQTSEQ